MDITRKQARTYPITVVFLLLLGFINFADKAVIGLAGPQIMQEWHLSPKQWGLVGSSFFALFSLSAIVVTGWIERVGARRFIGGLALIWSVIQLISMFASNLVMLVASRIMLGAGEGPSYGASLVAAAQWTPPMRRGTIFALLTLGSALGPALLSPAISLLISGIGWRWTFGLLGMLGILWFFLWRLHKPVTIEQTLVKEQTADEKEPGVWALLCQRRVLIAILCGFSAYWYLALLLVWIPTYLSDVRHLQMSGSSYLIGISVPWLGGGIIQIAIGYLVDRIAGHRNSRTLVLTCVLLSGALLLALVPLSPSTPLAIVFLALSPLGAVFPLVGTLLDDIAPSQRKGTIQGFAVGLYSLGGLVAPSVTGICVQQAANHETGYMIAFLLAAGLIFCSGICCWIFMRTRTERGSR